MTFPSGGPGYPQQGGSQQPYQPAPGTGSFPPVPPPASSGPLGPQNLPALAAIVVVALGLIQYFLGFSGEADLASGAITYLLVGGLLAGLWLLPKGPKTLPFAALLSVLGAFEVLDDVIGVPSGSTTPGIVVVVLILGIVQMIVAVGALLLEHGILKFPVSKPAAPPAPYGQQFGQPGAQQQFGQQPPRFGQPQGQPGQGNQPAPADQPTQFQPPATTAGPGAQSTTYSPQQGQFFQQQQQQSPEGGQSSPGTPPGGFGQPS
jgi:hypothetical protein